MLSALQAFLVTCSCSASSLTLPANQSELVGAKAATDGDVNNMTQVAKPLNLTEVTNSTTGSGGESKNSSTDSLKVLEGQSKNCSDSNQAKKAIDPLVMMPENLARNSSDNNNNNNKSNMEAKKTADPLVMMPESLADAGGKARLWLNQNNQMVKSSVPIRIM